MKIVLVHGFNVKDGGARTVDRLAPTLEDRGHITDRDTADYGYHNLIKVRFSSREAVERIAEAIEKADAVITHSNGANYVMKAAYMISSPILVLHMSPALNVKTNIPAVVSNMEVFHTTHDSAVKMSRVLRFGHPWGAMGAYGYKGLDTRARNHDYSYMVTAHSNWYKGSKAEFFGHKAADLLESL